MTNNYISGKQFYHWYQNIKYQTNQAQISSNELDFFVLELTSLNRLDLKLQSFKDFEQINLKIPFDQLIKMWEKRIHDHYPLQYLLGFTYWRNFKLKVTPDVLIPRPETEEIIDYVIKAIKNSNIPNLDQGDWVDLGTGSGAIACGLAEVFPNLIIHGVDDSASALKIAQENAQNLGFSERIKFYQGSWWQPLKHLKGKVKGMISNPPYIPTDQLKNLQVEVIKYEPYLALNGGKDGLNDIRYLINSAPQYLSNGGIWLIEMMKGQGEIVKKLLENNGNYINIQTCYDLDQADRFALAYFNH